MALSPPILLTYLGDGQPPTQEGSHYGNSSSPLFSVYSKIADEDDNAMAERLRKGADRNMIVVSPQVSFYAIACVNRKSIDSCIGCGQRYIPLNGDAAPIHSIDRGHAAHILSTTNSTTPHLGEPTLAF